MTDGQLTAALASLGLDQDNYPAVALLPLIEVAWADGRVQPSERRLIAGIAEGYGMPISEDWLARWLDAPPSATAFLTARTVLLGLMSRSDSRAEAPDTIDSLLDLCQRVAETAGGLFGIAFTVTRSERQCIEEIAQHLCRGPALPDMIAGVWRPIRTVRQRAPGPRSGGEARFHRPGATIVLPSRPVAASSGPRSAPASATMPFFAQPEVSEEPEEGT